MSQYIHEIVLQKFIIDNTDALDLIVNYNNSSEKIIDVHFNKTGTFWDLEGKLENGFWIPIEVEWITHNFYTHKHDRNTDFDKFIKDKGVLLVLRKNKQIPKVQQLSLLDNMTETQFNKLFKKWFKNHADEFIDDTLKDYMVGKYKRNVPRVILYPLSQNARKNYFSNGELYRKKEIDPAVLGFKEKGYTKNPFIRDLQPNDVCLFLDANGSRGKRSFASAFFKYSPESFLLFFSLLLLRSQLFSYLCTHHIP